VGSAAALVTVTVYVLVRVVSCAVTTTAIAVSPTLRLCTLDALPDVTALPLTDTVARASLVVGVTVTAKTPFATPTAYDVVVAANVGESVPVFNDSALSEKSVKPVAPLVTVTVYVVWLVLSPAVTTTGIAVFTPTAIVCPADAVPDVVDKPATFTDATMSVTVGKIIIDATAFTTVAVYAVVTDENEGDSVPELSTKLFKVATVFAPAAVLVTATAYVVVADVVS
jgi:hypothetical protein